MSLAMKFNTVLTATRKQFESSKGKGRSIEYTNVHSTRARSYFGRMRSCAHVPCLFFTYYHLDGAGYFSLEN